MYDSSFRHRVRDVVCEIRLLCLVCWNDVFVTHKDRRLGPEWSITDRVYFWIQLKVSREDKSVRVWPVCNIEYDSPLPCLWLQEDMGSVITVYDGVWEPRVRRVSWRTSTSGSTDDVFSSYLVSREHKHSSNIREWMSVSVSLNYTYPCCVSIHESFYPWYLTLICVYTQH